MSNQTLKIQYLDITKHDFNYEPREILDKKTP